MKPPRTLLVTDAGRGSALAFVRSLGRPGQSGDPGEKGWRVVAADEVKGSAGARSRFAHAEWVYPSPTLHADAYVDSIAEAVRVHDVDLVLPITDAAAHPLIHASARFGGGTRLIVPADDARRRVNDKEQTMRLARDLGVAVPRTVAVGTMAEAEAALRELTFPLVIKPASSSRYLPEEGRIERFSVSYANDEASLLESVAALVGRTRILLQEYHGGTGWGVELLVERGKIRAAFQHKRLAEIPVTGGASAWRESVPLDARLLESARRLVQALEWTGLLMVEFRGDAEPVLMEINGRVWGSLPLAVQAGMDFPARLLSMLTRPQAGVGDRHAGEAPELPDTQYRIGVKAYDPGHLLMWILATLSGRRRYKFVPAPGRRAALAGALALLDPRQRSDFYEPSDLRPAFIALRRGVGNVVRKLVPGRRVEDSGVRKPSKCTEIAGQSVAGRG